jgi:tRNA nucleotidyltransferase (CCA-adding enzyme)
VSEAAAGLRVYCVGGAVRDELLGLPVRDRDWVVVGATPQALLERGFRPVGKDFPVFLHPETHEEYALARTERKTGAGYRGFTVHFAPEVTLEEDLCRRDLTINAIARGPDGELIDPLGGIADLRARVLRHAGPAFIEDPVRILRLARFAARFADFTIAPETRALVARMSASGELDALVPERVWQEFARGLMSSAPSRMLESLREAGALSRLLPGLAAGEDVLRALDAAAATGATLPVRTAALLRAGLGEDVAALTALATRLRMPAEVRDLARLVVRDAARIARADTLPPAQRLALLEGLDALRRPARLDEALAACDALAAGGFVPPDPDGGIRRAGRALRAAHAAAARLDAAAIAASAREQGVAGEALRERIRAARIDAIAAIDSLSPSPSGSA